MSNIEYFYIQATTGNTTKYNVYMMFDSLETGEITSDYNNKHEFLFLKHAHNALYSASKHHTLSKLKWVVRKKYK